VQARSSLTRPRATPHAADVSWLAGVVGWVDLTDPQVGEVLAGLRAGRLVGVRHQVAESRIRVAPPPDVERGIEALEREGLAYDCSCRGGSFPRPSARAGVIRCRFVVDHLAKPPVRTATRARGRGLAALASLPNVCASCRASSRGDWSTWTPTELLPYLRRALDWFGPDLMFGSDLAVCLLARLDEVCRLLLACSTGTSGPP